MAVLQMEMDDPDALNYEDLSAVAHLAASNRYRNIMQVFHCWCSHPVSTLNPCKSRAVLCAHIIPACPAAPAHVAAIESSGTRLAVSEYHTDCCGA